jgi:hypothetical protein
MSTRDESENRRNKPATIIITVVALVVVIASIGGLVKIGASLNNMNTYSGAAAQARRALDNLEIIALNDAEVSTNLNARENAEKLRHQVDSFKESVYDLNRNKLASSDLDAHNIYTVIEIRTQDFAKECDDFMNSLEKMASGESYELATPDKSALKARLSELVNYLEKKALE